jgi:hypothetical protein
MSTSFIKTSILCFVIAFANSVSIAQPGKGLGIKDIVQFFSRTKDCGDDCCAKLSLAKLCAKRIRAQCLDISSQINAANICSETVNTDRLCATNACIQNLNVNTICVANPGVATQAEVCGLWRATVVYSAPTLYTLGDPLNFDIILDDPNGNIETVFPDTTYTVPKSGYYIVTLKIDQKSLITFSGDPILGTPVANPQILVNGTVYREGYFPYLAFSGLQKSLLTSIISLNAGDVVSGKFEVYALNDSGFQSIVGTVNISGNGTEGGQQSLFKIHYLSSDCTGTPPCQPCGPCQVPCGMCPNPCDDSCM